MIIVHKVGTYLQQIFHVVPGGCIPFQFQPWPVITSWFAPEPRDSNLRVPFNKRSEITVGPSFVQPLCKAWMRIFQMAYLSDLYLTFTMMK